MSPLNPAQSNTSKTRMADVIAAQRVRPFFVLKLLKITCLALFLTNGSSVQSLFKRALTLILIVLLSEEFFGFLGAKFRHKPDGRSDRQTLSGHSRVKP